MNEGRQRDPQRVLLLDPEPFRDLQRRPSHYTPVSAAKPVFRRQKSAGGGSPGARRAPRSSGCGGLRASFAFSPRETAPPSARSDDASHSGRGNLFPTGGFPERRRERPRQPGAALCLQPRGRREVPAVTPPRAGSRSPARARGAQTAGRAGEPQPACSVAPAGGRLVRAGRAPGGCRGGRPGTWRSRAGARGPPPGRHLGRRGAGSGFSMQSAQGLRSPPKGARDGGGRGGCGER